MLNSPYVAGEARAFFDKAIAINIYQNVFKFTFYNCAKASKSPLPSHEKTVINLANSIGLFGVFVVVVLRVLA